MRLPKFRSRTPQFDEFGGLADGALAIIVDDKPIHLSPHRITAALRYFLAKAQSPGESQLPGCLAVTSALRGEGVSYVTRSLAAILAYDGQASVGLVDLNWTIPASDIRRRRWRPRDRSARLDSSSPGPKGADDVAIDEVDEVESRPPEGRIRTIVDAVEDRASLDDIIQPTANPRLCLVAPGEVPRARRPAMAGSQALEKVIRQITGRFDYVLLDLPPVLASSDAITLAQLADSFLLVVRQGVTSTVQVESALEELRGTDSMGIILNRFDSHVPRVVRKVIGV